MVLKFTFFKARYKISKGRATLVVLASVIFIFTSASGDDQRKLDVGIIYVSKLFILGVSSSFEQATCMPYEMFINVHKLQQNRPLIVVGG